MSESDLYGQLMIEATRLGHRLFRNNVGRAKYKSGKGDVFTVPYGVGGVGGSDLVGETMRRVVTHAKFAQFFEENSVDVILAAGANYVFDQIGEQVAVFTAIEVKRPGKKPTAEQLKFLEAVRAAGGIAGVCCSVSDYHELIGHRP